MNQFIDLSEKEPELRGGIICINMEYNPPITGSCVWDASLNRWKHSRSSIPIREGGVVGTILTNKGIKHLYTHYAEANFPKKEKNAD